MRTVEQKVYEFKELSAEVQEKVLDKHRYINVDYDDWYKWILDNWQNKLEEMGFKNPKIEFSGFGSQGDGASFTCDEIDYKVMYEKNIFVYNFMHKAVKELFFNNISGSIKRFTNMYVHENTVTLDWSIDNYINVVDEYPLVYHKLVEIGYRVVEQIDRYRLGKCHEIYNELEGYYYDLISDEQVKETLEANEFEFYSNGELY